MTKRGPKPKFDLILTERFLYQKYIIEKKSMAKIANEVGCGRSLINKKLKQHNIKIRSISESKMGIKNSPETRTKISKALKGKMVGEKNPFYGKKHSLETKKKLSESNKGKGQPHNEETKKKISAAHKGKIVSKETRKKLSKSRIGTTLSEKTKRKISLSVSGKNNPMWGKPRPDMLGPNNPSWKGGTTKLIQTIRTCVHYNIWRQKIYERDKFTCVKCGEQTSGNLNADHIIPLSFLIKEYNIKSLKEAKSCKNLWDISNGRTLCIECHKQTNTWGHKAIKFIL